MHSQYTIAQIDELTAIYREQLIAEMNEQLEREKNSLSLFNRNLREGANYIHDKTNFKWIHYHKRIKEAIVDYFGKWNYQLNEVGSSYTNTQIKHQLDYDFVAINQFHDSHYYSVADLVNAEKDKLAVVIQGLSKGYALSIPGVYILKIEVRTWDTTHNVKIYYANGRHPYQSVFAFDVIPGICSEGVLFTPSRSLDYWVSQNKQKIKETVNNNHMTDLVKALKLYNYTKLQRRVSGCWFEFAVCHLLKNNKLMVFQSPNTETTLDPGASPSATSAHHSSRNVNASNNNPYCFFYNLAVIMQYLIRVMNGQEELKHEFEDYSLKLEDPSCSDTMKQSLQHIKTQLTEALEKEIEPEAMYSAIFLQ
jgi:hypothetical protein